MSCIQTIQEVVLFQGFLLPEPEPARVCNKERTRRISGALEAAAHSSHLHEREDEAHSEVGHPVKRTSNYVGCWPVGLLEQLRSYQERDPRWKPR